jgi:hypothetical protein
MDAAQRPTMSEVCEILASTNWRVFPGADAKKVAEAELELRSGEAASPATDAGRIGKLDAEGLSSKSENAKFKSENARLTSEIARMRPDPAPMKRVVVAPMAVRQRDVAIRAGTLLAECESDLKALGLEWKAADLLLAKGAGWWDPDEFKAKVFGKVPVVVLVGVAGGVSGGFSAVPFGVRSGVTELCWTADPTGTSFVFSLRPTAARSPLRAMAKATCWGRAGFTLGDGCLTVLHDGRVIMRELAYVAPGGWVQSLGSWVKVTRFEV